MTAAADDETTPADAGPAVASGAALDELGFSAAIEELRTIVDELESDDLDVDLLAPRVERAAEIVEWSRARIDGTRFQVDEILTRLSAPIDDPEG
jgi:exodeoxyribonuclease VII small subunit